MPDSGLRLLNPFFSFFRRDALKEQLGKDQTRSDASESWVVVDCKNKVVILSVTFALLKEVSAVDRCSRHVTASSHAITNGNYSNQGRSMEWKFVICNLFRTTRIHLKIFIFCIFVYLFAIEMQLLKYLRLTSSDKIVAGRQQVERLVARSGPCQKFLLQLSCQGCSARWT